MTTLVYLHGFASAGTSQKSDNLKREFGVDNVIAPDLPLDPKEVVATITNIIKSVKNYPIIFVGTSLGGFYANYFAQKYDCPAILVNPATIPSKTLFRAVGPVKNFKTGEISEWKVEYLDTLAKMEKEVGTIHTGGLVNLFVSRDDEIIDPDETLANYPHTVHTTITDTGGHRYNEHFDKVIDRIKEIIK